MKNQKLIWMAGAVAVVLIAVSIGYLLWQKGSPRRACLQSAANLHAALQSGDSAKLLETVALPISLQDRTSAEQSEFLYKALHGEITPEGLAILNQNGRFGPLQDIFPDEAAKWAGPAGVKAADCVAFRLDHSDDTRAEVVLVKTGGQFRIVRCNNVTAPAQTQLLTTNQP